MLLDAAGVRRRCGVLVTALLALTCALVVPAVASAEEFEVNSTGDGTDAALGDEVCLTSVISGEKCTLRAAIEEANSLGESTKFEFDESVFDGQAVGSTITPASPFPVITVPINFNGHECPTVTDPRHPCVGIDGPIGGTALAFENSASVEVQGLDVTGAKTGISAVGSPGLKVQASWFGVKLDDSPGGDGTAIVIGPGSNESLIGSEGSQGGNVIANSGGDGLDIHGASTVKVFGNYFGVEKNGITPARNGGKDIEVTSTSSESATGTAIGTRVSPAAAATPACDGGCNVISGAGSSGIDLQGDGGTETPAVETTIAGNYIGLDASGGAAVPNETSDIEVGKAARSIVGGPRVADANRINGGATGVLAGPEAEDLIVRGNLIGLDAAGTGTLAPPAEAISVNSEGLTIPAQEAQISNNEIRMEGGIAISQQGFGATISGNEIFGAGTGVRASGEIEEHGNLIEGNSITGLEANGIVIENNFNELFGNKISQALGAGILIHRSPLFGVTGNVVGGDAARDENTISGSGGDAIEISNPENTENEVARNRGTGNAGLFIHLVPAPSSEPKGPNKGIKPPVFSTASQISAGGTAQAGARVRVFRKQSAAAGELESFLGEAIANPGGKWSISYGGAIPSGTIVAATQTNEAGGTSQLTTATTSGAVGGGAPPSPALAPPPQTKIVTGPKKKSHSDTARFKFSSDEPGSSFECKLDGKPFARCRSPKTYRNLRPGEHVFKVRAIGPAGSADPRPAKWKFTVVS